MVAGEQARVLLSRHGEVRPQPASDWTGTFELPGSLSRYYREVGPVGVTIDGYGNPYFLPSLADLWDFQAGYRWNSRTGDPVTEWDDDWLVVADEGGDPFILSRRGNGILLAQHGTGSWEPREIFSDLNAMASALSILGAVVVDAGQQLTDDDGLLTPQSLHAAQRGLTELLGSSSRADDVLAMLGWIEL